MGELDVPPPLFYQQMFRKENGGGIHVHISILCELSLKKGVFVSNMFQRGFQGTQVTLSLRPCVLS